MKFNLKRFIIKRILVIVLFGIGLVTFPYWWCEREADYYFNDDLVQVSKLQKGVESWLKKDLDLADYTTGSKLFNGEWLFGTYIMSGLGLCQVAVNNPEMREHNLPLIERCIERLLTPQVKSFDVNSWDNDPILDLADDSKDHAAYLGYFNLLLSFNRLVNPNTKYAQLNDDITAALARRLARSKTQLLFTYPNELYPVDNCAVIASIGLYDKAMGLNTHAELVKSWMAYCREHYVDKKTGLLIQAVSTLGTAIDEPRGSGSALGLYFLSFVDKNLARSLYQAVKKELATIFLNFGAVREYPHGTKHEREDIDSGPIVLGFGFSATGFTIAGSKVFRDETYFSRLYASAYLAGAPYERDNARTFVTGGPLGTSILFAMLTAIPEVK